MLALDTYKDNLCLWRCIAVHRGARPDRSTQGARELAKSFFKLKAAPNDIPKTSLNELDKVERHLNQGAPFLDWLGIRVYEPERMEGEVVWHLRRNPPAKLTNILTKSEFMRGTHSLSRIFQSLQERIHAFIAVDDLLKPLIFNDMPKGAPKARR